MRGPRRTARAACIWMPLLLAALPLRAQISGSVGVTSDYRYRGLSLSEDIAAPVFSANYDDASGVYMGVALARARLRQTAADAVATSYVGIALPLTKSLAWEVGASETVFHGAARYNYHELYAGLNTERIGARLSFAPRYVGVGGRMVYGEVNGNWPLTERIDLIAHAGYLHSVGGPFGGWGARPAPRADGRIGGSMVVGDWTAQLALSATRDGAALYPGSYGRRPRSLVLSVLRTF